MFDNVEVVKEQINEQNNKWNIGLLLFINSRLESQCQSPLDALNPAECTINSLNPNRMSIHNSRYHHRNHYTIFHSLSISLFIVTKGRIFWHIWTPRIQNSYYCLTVTYDLTNFKHWVILHLTFQGRSRSSWNYFPLVFSSSIWPKSALWDTSLQSLGDLNLDLSRLLMVKPNGAVGFPV